MNGELTLNNSIEFPYSISMPQELRYSSDSSVDAFDKIVEQEKIITDKFSLLKKDVGDELFNRLSYEQKTFIANVSNTINLGDSVNIDVIYGDIEKLEYE